MTIPTVEGLKADGMKCDSHLLRFVKLVDLDGGLSVFLRSIASFHVQYILSCPCNRAFLSTVVFLSCDFHARGVIAFAIYDR